MKGQDTLSAPWAETKTLELYNDKKWDELLLLGKQALSKGYDYYYMRMRVAIAFYEKKNYILAEKHLEKAIIFNSFDDVAKEYLYYCYLYTGRNEQARLLSRTFTSELAAKTGTDKSRSVEYLLFEAGTKLSDSVSYYDAHTGRSSNYFNPAVYIHAGLNHYIKNRVSAFHAVTFFNQETFLGITKQRQYYLNVSVPFRKNWMVSPAFHLIGLSSETRAMSPPSHGKPPPPTIVVTNNTYYVGSLAADKMAGKTLLTVGSTVSNMNGTIQYLHSAAAAYYFLGNSKIVFGCTGYLHTVDNYTSLNLSYAPYLFLQPHQNFSLRLSYLANQNNNIIELNGYIVNNSADLTKQRYSALATLNISRSVALYALYQIEMKQERVQLFNYKYNVIVAGFRITPQRQ
ncbi:MAG: tetratricopeptide repeat protein [Bacteroidia bacterium]